MVYRLNFKVHNIRQDKYYYSHLILILLLLCTCTEKLLIPADTVNVSTQSLVFHWTESSWKLLKFFLEEVPHILIQPLINNSSSTN